MKTPSVSVLLPVRLPCPGLDQALASLTGQTLGNFEIVLVIDPASGTRPWSSPFDDRRIRIVTGTGAGLVATLNHGLALCRGPLIARMDGDDVSLPGRLAAQAGCLDRRPDLSILGTAVRVTGSAGAGYHRYARWHNGLRNNADMVRDLFIESPLAHPTVMMRREAAHALEGYREFDGPEDYDMWLRASARGLHMAKLGEPLVLWHDSDDRTSRRDPRYRRSKFRRLKAHHLKPRLGGHVSVVIWGAGDEGGRLCDALVEAGITVSSFVDVAPRRIGRHKRSRPVHPPEFLRDCPEFLVAAVSSVGARAQIRARLQSLGRREGDDFLVAA